MKRLRHTVIGLALGAAIAGLGAPGLAAPSLAMPSSLQAASGVQVRADLAAAALAADDMPQGFAFVGETFLDASQVAGKELDPKSLTDAGFQTEYVSVYENKSQNLRIRSYLSAWNDDQAAAAGFGIVEDETKTSPGAKLTDSATTLGEEPGEVTTGTYTDASGATVGTVDITFRRGNLLAGVAVEKLDGSASDAKLAGDLGKRLDARVQQVQGGKSPAHTDLALPGKALSLASLGTDVQVGFLGPVEVEALYGLQGSVLDSVQASWVESATVGSGDAAKTRVTIGVTTFGKAADAASVVDHVEELAQPLKNQEAVKDAKVEGADKAKAFRFTSPASSGDAIDSYRVVYATGTTLTVIDVQGAPSDTAAADAANALVTAQTGCAGGGACEVPALKGLGGA